MAYQEDEIAMAENDEYHRKACDDDDCDYCRAMEYLVDEVEP